MDWEKGVLVYGVMLGGGKGAGRKEREREKQKGLLSLQQ